MSTPSSRPSSRTLPRAFCVVGCSCLLALFGMLAAKRDREQEERLLAAQQELAHQQARYQELERRLRRSRSARAVASESTVAISRNATPPASESLLAMAELVQAEMHAGLAEESPGWCFCPPKPNYTRICSALSPADGIMATARTEAERLREEAERLRRLVAREKLQTTRANEQLLLAQAELAQSRSECSGKRRRRGKTRMAERAVEAAPSSQQLPTAETCSPWVNEAHRLLADAVGGKMRALREEAAANASRLEQSVRTWQDRCGASMEPPSLSSPAAATTSALNTAAVKATVPAALPATVRATVPASAVPASAVPATAVPASAVPVTVAVPAAGPAAVTPAVSVMPMAAAAKPSDAASARAAANATSSSLAAPTAA